MDKARARQLYELADRLSQVDVATLSEQQLSEREQMIARLQQELKQGVAEAEVDESNAFTDARMNAIKAGKKEFTLNGKEYKVTGDTSDEKVVEDDITTEAYERLYRVFDFSNFKG